MRLLFIALAVATAQAQTYTLPLDGPIPAQGALWKRVDRAAADARVVLTVQLSHTAEQLRVLEETFWAVSDPDSPTYGQHLRQAEVTDIVAAADSTIDAVSEWLQSGGAALTVGVHRDSIEAALSVQDAEALLNTTFFEFATADGDRVHRVGAPCTAPTALAPYISVIGGAALLPRLSGPIVVPDDDDDASDADEVGGDWPTDCGLSCRNKVTPGVLAQRYSLPAAPSGPTKGSMGISEFQGQVWDHADLDKFAKTCGLSNVTVDHQAGTVAKGWLCRVPLLGVEACGEALLDIEYIKGVGGSIPLTNVYSFSYNLLKWAQDLEKMADGEIPLVMSVSYGNDEVQQTSTAFMKSANVEFQKLGVRGVSILFASGDQGVCGRSGCSGKFHPDFPAGSPYITVVGGTDFAEANVVGEEKAWADGGGGFSDTFDAPAYQQAAVAQYMKTAGAQLPTASKWNAKGRGYPDVAALAGIQNAYCIAAGSFLMGIGGTSAACPVTAAIFARLNEMRLASGGSALGFLNPWIYKNAAGFNDVTKGNNNGGGSEGFPAVAGWDAATGVGTPNFAALAKLL